MKRIIATLLLITVAATASEIYAPNLKKNVTGTTVSSKNGLDVNIIGGAAGAGVSGTTWVNGDGGSSALAVRKDSEGALTGIDNGENTPLQVDSNGRLKVDAATTEVATAANGGSLPAVTKIIAGYDGTNVRVIKADSTGRIDATVSASALPTGAATAANQSTANASLSSIDGKITAVNTGAVVISSSALPSGAATSAKQDTGNTSLGNIDTSTSGMSAKLPATLGQKTMANSMAVVVSSDQSAIPASQSGTWNVNNVSGTISLPTGAATETTLAALNAKATVINTNSVMIGSALPTGTKSIGKVSLQDGSANAITSVAAGSLRGIHTRSLGRTAADKARNDYSSVNVTTSAYTQLIASTAAEAHEVEIFDSSGQTLFLATGAAASEVNQVYIIPGGNGRIPLRIAAGTRISVKAVSGTASAGEIDINLYGE